MIAEALRKGIAAMIEIHEITMIDHWFIDKMAILVEMEDALENRSSDSRTVTKKQRELNSRITVIARLTGKSRGRDQRRCVMSNGIVASL